MSKYKFYLRACLFLLVFSGGVRANEESAKQIDKLIQEDIYKNRHEIEKLSWNLTEEERKKILIKYRRDVFFPVFLNLLLGFGIGSYIEGDLLGGILGSSTGVVYYTTISVGLINYFFDTSGNPGAAATPWFIAAGVSGVAYLLIEILRPSAYASRFNKVLFDSLKIEEKITMNIFPYARPVEYSRKPDEGVLAGVTIRF